MEHNKWAKYYIDTEYNGKMPKTKQGLEAVEWLNAIETGIIVEFPTGECAYALDLSHDNVPNGIMSVALAVSNIRYWLWRGWNVYFQ